MATTTIRLSVETQKIVRELAREQKQTMSAIIQKAVDHYRTEVMFKQANAVWEKMREDPQAWEEEMAEQRLWEGTLMDGLEDE